MKPARLRDWKGDKASHLLCTEVAPVAKVALLLAADSAVESVAFSPYAQPALAFAGNTSTFGTSRRLGIVIGPGCRYGRAHLTRAGAGIGSQAVSTLSSATSGTTPADVISAVSAVNGAEVYLDGDATVANQVGYTVTSAQPHESPSATMDRALLLPEGKAPTVDEIEVGMCVGFGLQVSEQTGDLETL